MIIHAFTDGASRGNPGESGIGFVLKDEHGTVLYSASGYLGTATNNTAEYRALLGCLVKVSAMGCTRLVVHSDSELMVRQLQGTYRVKDKNLQELFREARACIAKAGFEFRIVHIDRSLNKEADALANNGIDSRQPLNL